MNQTAAAARQLFITAYSKMVFPFFVVTAGAPWRSPVFQSHLLQIRRDDYR
ncbi:MAG: hypothetical protein ACKO71_00620 [Betaproteobacteria bacterium]